MIIKVTFKDNDFTEILENYFKSNFLMATEERYADDEFELWKQARLAREYFEKFLRDKEKFPTNEKELFIKFLRSDILNYILQKSDIDSNFDYLRKNIEVKVLDKIGEQWQNGEYVYYFPMHHKIITM